VGGIVFVAQVYISPVPVQINNRKVVSSLLRKEYSSWWLFIKYANRKLLWTPVFESKVIYFTLIKTLLYS